MLLISIVIIAERESYGSQKIKKFNIQYKLFKIIIKK